VSFPAVSPDKRMCLRLRPQGGFFDAPKRKYGLLMHDILKDIVTQDDIPAAVALKQSGGEITADEAASLVAMLKKLTADEQVRHWFDGSHKVMNEVEILFGGGRAARPDRLLTAPDGGRLTVIDYKFGDVKDDKYHRQMQKYRSLLHEMGFMNVECFLWYVSLGELEKINNVKN